MEEETIKVIADASEFIGVVSENLRLFRLFSNYGQDRGP